MDQRTLNLIPRVKEIESGKGTPYQAVLWYHSGDGLQSFNDAAEEFILNDWPVEEYQTKINGVQIIEDYRYWNSKMTPVLIPEWYGVEESGVGPNWDKYDRDYDELIRLTQE